MSEVSTSASKMTKEIHKKLIWENRLALWLPGGALVGGSIIAVCLNATYLGFVWIFDLSAVRWAVLLPLIIANAIMVPRYLATRDSLDPKVTHSGTRLLTAMAWR